MSVHIEYLSASATAVEYLPETELAQSLSIDDPGEDRVLVLGTDSVVVITGTAGELLALARRISATIEPARCGVTPRRRSRRELLQIMDETLARSRGTTGVDEVIREFREYGGRPPATPPGLPPATTDADFERWVAVLHEIADRLAYGLTGGERDGLGRLVFAVEQIQDGAR